MNKFNEIFLDLEQKILAKEYPPHSLLPSENQLIKIYGVSRETIRKALNLLTTEGYIQKKQGKGSIVLDRNRFDFPISGLTSYKELQETQRIPSETIIHTLEETDKSIERDHWLGDRCACLAFDTRKKNQWRSSYIRHRLSIKGNRSYFNSSTSTRIDL